MGGFLSRQKSTTGVIEPFIKNRTLSTLWRLGEGDRPLRAAIRTVQGLAPVSPSVSSCRSLRV